MLPIVAGKGNAERKPRIPDRAIETISELRRRIRIVVGGVSTDPDFCDTSRIQQLIAVLVDTHEMRQVEYTGVFANFQIRQRVKAQTLSARGGQLNMIGGNRYSLDGAAQTGHLGSDQADLAAQIPLYVLLTDNRNIDTQFPSLVRHIPDVGQDTTVDDRRDRLHVVGIEQVLRLVVKVRNTTRYPAL